MIHGSRLTAGLLLAVLVAGCNSNAAEKDLDKLDAKIAGKAGDADPALTSALEDQILVDPTLANQANRNAARPTNEPFAAPVPKEGDEAVANANAAADAAGRAASGVSGGTSASGATTLGELAATQAARGKNKFTGCGLDVTYSMTWANRLPSDLPLYPQARVAEAAGSDRGACRLRAVSYATSAPMRQVVDFYLSQARRAGYSADYDSKQQMVGGVRPRDGGAWYAIVQPTNSGGTLVDLVTNNGS